MFSTYTMLNGKITKLTLDKMRFLTEKCVPKMSFFTMVPSEMLLKYALTVVTVENWLELDVFFCR